MDYGMPGYIVDVVVLCECVWAVVEDYRSSIVSPTKDSVPQTITVAFCSTTGTCEGVWDLHVHCTERWDGAAHSPERRRCGGGRSLHDWVGTVVNDLRHKPTTDTLSQRTIAIASDTASLPVRSRDSHGDCMSQMSNRQYLTARLVLMTISIDWTTKTDRRSPLGTTITRSPNKITQNSLL